MNEALIEDLETVTIPFELTTGLNLVIEEIESRGYIYTHLTAEGPIKLFSFSDEEEDKVVTVNIEKENLLIREFNMIGASRKLMVLHILGPSERTFQLHK